MSKAARIPGHAGDQSSPADPALRTSLLRSLVLLMLVFCIAIFGLRLAGAYRDVEKLSRSLIDAKTDVIEAQLGRFFAPARTGLRIARDWGRSGLLPLGEPERINDLFIPFLERNPLVSAVILADSDGREYMLMRTGSGWLNKLVDVSAAPGVARHRLYSQRGDALEESEQAIDYDPRSRPWFEGAVDLADPQAIHWTAPYAFFTSREAGITASTRWFGEGAREYVLAFDVQLRDITAFTAHLEVSPRGRAAVLDETGLVLGLPRDPRFSGRKAVGEALLLPVRELGIPSLADAYGAWAKQAQTPEAFAFESEGTPWRGGMRAFELAPGRELLIGITAPEADLLGDLASQRNQFLASTGFALLAAVVVALLLDRVIRRRLDRALSQAGRVGQYTLEHAIGSGGMGTVYLARHAMLRRPTAVKLLSSDDPEAVARFEREVQLTSELAHPNTIAVYDYGRTPEGQFYYAMEYLVGITLQTLVERFGPVAADRVISILLQICGSLAEAHARGLVHRDVKPQNVMLCSRGGRHDVVKVLDFGLVKDVAGGEDLEITEQHAIPGSPLFLSPEAVRGGEFVEPRSDLYSLGALAYYLLTGRSVFTGSNAWAICLQHLHESPKPPSARVDFEIPGDLEQVVMDCLRKHPENRPQNALALALRLEACSDAGRWGEGSSREWWTRHETELAELRKGGATDEPGAPRRLSIDLGDRVGSGDRS